MTLYIRLGQNASKPHQKNDAYFKFGVANQTSLHNYGSRYDTRYGKSASKNLMLLETSNVGINNFEGKEPS